MNCRRTVRMISLYVAGDLVGAPEREVATHLSACDACRRLADEFSESTGLLAEACAPPEFGAEFYSGIRHAVLGGIASGQLPGKPSLFRPRWLYATAFAALVIVSGVTLPYFLNTKREPPKELASAPQVAGQPTLPPEVPSPGKKHELPRTRSVQSIHLLASAGSHRSVPQLAASQAVQDSPAQLAPAIQSSTNIGPIALEASSQLSRIEIQTADPNIRIIWLSPRESGEPDGIKPDQDHPETSNRK